MAVNTITYRKFLSIITTGISSASFYKQNAANNLWTLFESRGLKMKCSKPQTTQIRKEYLCILR